MRNPATHTVHPPGSLIGRGQTAENLSVNAHTTPHTPKRSASDRRRSGFTMVEVLAALTITTVVIGGVALTLNTAMRSQGQQTVDSQARSSLRRVVDAVSSQVESRAFLTILPGSNDRHAGVVFVDPSRSMRVLSMAGSTITVDHPERMRTTRDGRNELLSLVSSEGDHITYRPLAINGNVITVSPLDAGCTPNSLGENTLLYPSNIIELDRGGDTVTQRDDLVDSTRKDAAFNVGVLKLSYLYNGGGRSLPAKSEAAGNVIYDRATKVRYTLSAIGLNVQGVATPGGNAAPSYSDSIDLKAGNTLNARNLGDCSSTAGGGGGPNDGNKKANLDVVYHNIPDDNPQDGSPDFRAPVNIASTTFDNLPFAITIYNTARINDLSGAPGTNNATLTASNPEDVGSNGGNRIWKPSFSRNGETVSPNTFTTPLQVNSTTTVDVNYDVIPGSICITINNGPGNLTVDIVGPIGDTTYHSSNIKWTQGQPAPNVVPGQYQVLLQNGFDAQTYWQPDNAIKPVTVDSNGCATVTFTLITQPSGGGDSGGGLPPVCKTFDGRYLEPLPDTINTYYTTTTTQNADGTTTTTTTRHEEIIHNFKEIITHVEICVDANTDGYNADGSPINWQSTLDNAISNSFGQNIANSPSSTGNGTTTDVNLGNRTFKVLPGGLGENASIKGDPSWMYSIGINYNSKPGGTTSQPTPPPPPGCGQNC